MMWDWFPITASQELRLEMTRFEWPWMLVQTAELIGPELLYRLGLEALQYPPTWVDTIEEQALIEDAINNYLLGENHD